jgi:hypothetical protein
MLHLSSEDTASVGAVLGTLEAQIAELGAESKIRHLWRDWTDLLGPAGLGAIDRSLNLVLDQVTPGR